MVDLGEISKLVNVGIVHVMYPVSIESLWDLIVSEVHGKQVPSTMVDETDYMYRMTTPEIIPETILYWAPDQAVGLAMDQTILSGEGFGHEVLSRSLYRIEVYHGKHQQSLEETNIEAKELADSVRSKFALPNGAVAYSEMSDLYNGVTRVLGE